MDLEVLVRERLEQDVYLRAALPALVHRVNNATQILTGLNALLGLPGGAALLAARSGDLDAVSELYERSGWLLGVFGSALGASTLNERRERDGLVPVLDLARELFRRQGRELAFSGALPLLAPRAGRGWEAPWTVGSWLHGALLAAPAGACVRVSMSRDRGAVVLEDDAPFGPERARLARTIAARVEGVACDESVPRLVLAAAWFEPDAST
ncbi:MAG: hypothetical protein IPJ77_17675 [Planctomycetes bacterium]|nr:hypothetical protein [Planctomycetota bacterium]